MTTGTSRARPPATSSAGGPSLLERWAERDARYAGRKVPLSAHDALVVREARIRESGATASLVAIAARWTPPEAIR